MELLIIQYSLAVVLWVYIFTFPFRIVLIIADTPKTLWLLPQKKWKRLF